MQLLRSRIVLASILALPVAARAQDVSSLAIPADMATSPGGRIASQLLGAKGVRVAALDSGIDYTHRNLKGSGDRADWVKAYGTSLDDPRNQTVNPALFPTDKVVGGFDFVGERWPNPDARCPDAKGNPTV